MKLFFRGVIFCFIAYIALHPLYSYYNGTLFERPQASHCGIIVAKKDPTVPYTHKSNTRLTVEPMFIVNFEDVGYQEIQPSWNSFYNHEVGDKVCYDYDLKIDWVKEIFDLIGLMILGVGSVALLIIFLSWVFNWE